MIQILWHDGLTLLEVLKEPELDCGGDLLADLRDLGGQLNLVRICPDREYKKCRGLQKALKEVTWIGYR